ncbi:Mo-dependent nitrogenase C-terminal domain-containing protein [Phormidium tenue FACHB-886]|nr:Mo-dependent nitrogenase C-terminal domain-containing protein [Phormidium tenue FACHB-886]
MTPTSTLLSSDSLQIDTQQIYLSSSSSLQSNFSQPSLQNRPGSSSQRVLLQPIRNWLDRLQVRDSKTAHRIAKLIPSQCPFERDIKLFGRTVAHIPPLCKLNPFYDQFVGLRFRALCYLVDECGEDIQSYC